MFNQRYPPFPNNLKDLNCPDLSDSVPQDPPPFSCALPPNFKFNRCKSVHSPSQSKENFSHALNGDLLPKPLLHPCPTRSICGIRKIANRKLDKSQRPIGFGKNSGIKDFLMGRLRGKKPKYYVQSPNHWNRTFICRLAVEGMDYEATAEARNKKDAENKAAWNYSEHLIKCGMLGKFELPVRPPSLGGESLSGKKMIKYAKENKNDIFEHGGWVRSNSVKRLAQFCTREDCCADYKQYTSELQGYKTFFCDLTLRVSSVQKVFLNRTEDLGSTNLDGFCVNLKPVEYSCTESGTSKDIANELCSLSMVRMLFVEGLIERAGEPIRGSVMDNGPPPIPVMTSNKEINPKTTSPASRVKITTLPPAVSRANKIREEIEVILNGGWILTNSLSRLNEFVIHQQKNCHCQFRPMYLGTAKDMTYIHQIYLTIYSLNKEYFFTAKESKRKLAKTTCAMRLVRRLFAEGLIERAGDKKMTAFRTNVPSPIPVFISEKKLKRSRCKPRHRRKSHVRRISPIKSPIRNPTRSSPLKRKADTAPEVEVKPKMRKFLTTKPQANHNFVSQTSSLDGKAASEAQGKNNSQDLFPLPFPRARNISVILDEYINEKHNELCPTDDELHAVYTAVRQTELILVETDREMRTRKGYCDTFMIGCVLVGDFTKNLLIHQHLNAEMVILCEKIPTDFYYKFVAQILNETLENWRKKTTFNCKLEEDSARAALILRFSMHDDVKVTSYDVTVTIYLTSSSLRAMQKENRMQRLPPSVLNTTSCLKALSKIRRTEWFKACASKVSNYQIITRILRDLKRRSKAWQVLDDWTLDLITNNVYLTSPEPLSSLTSILQRIFQRIASGLFVSDDRNITDPCEEDPADVAQHMSKQERQDLTDAAKIALQQILCCEPHKILQITNK